MPFFDARRSLKVEYKFYGKNILGKRNQPFFRAAVRPLEDLLFNAKTRRRKEAKIFNNHFASLCAAASLR
jgi:hypothetical protein